MSSDLIYAPLSKLLRLPLAQWVEREFHCVPIKKMMIRRFKDNNADVLEFTDTATHLLRSFGGKVPSSRFKTDNIADTFDLPWDDDTLKLILAAIYKGFEHQIGQAGADHIIMCLPDYVVMWFMARYGKDDMKAFSWNW